jgi:hypothetical protein
LAKIVPLRLEAHDDLAASPSVVGSGAALDEAGAPDHATHRRRFMDWRS